MPQAQTTLDIKAECIQSPPKQRPTSFDIFTVENKKDEFVVEDKVQTAETKDVRVVGGSVNYGDVEKAGGDAAICEYLYCLLVENILNY